MWGLNEAILGHIIGKQADLEFTGHETARPESLSNIPHQAGVFNVIISMEDSFLLVVVLRGLLLDRFYQGRREFFKVLRFKLLDELLQVLPERIRKLPLR